jgi:hypothetical protein
MERQMSDGFSIANSQRGSKTLEKKVLIENLNVALVPEQEVGQFQMFIQGCEMCSPEASLPFDYLLDELLGCDPTSTEYLMYRTAVCPSCKNAITEKTLVVVG